MAGGCLRRRRRWNIIATIIDAWAHGVVVGRVIYNASTMGYDIAVVVKTLWG